jgi:hypothetical protein
MITKPSLKDETKTPRTSVEAARCFSCERALKDSSEWVRSGKKTMCLDCYESLIDPFPKRCHAGLLL